MYHRRHLLIELSALPWWASVVTACAVYGALKWGLPALADSSRLLNTAANGLADNAGWLAAVLLLPLPFALVHARRRARLMHGQSGIDSARALSWQEFEQLVGEYYRQQGYRVVESGGGGADGGIDLVLSDAKGKKLVVQCKRWKSRTVGVVLVRELYGAMADKEAHAAIFVTSGRYTPDALAFARDKPIKLIDGSELVDMIQSARVPRAAPARSEPTLCVADPVRAGSDPLCPRCGGAMAFRVAQRGELRGRSFWGCSSYPRCKGTRPS